MKTNKTIANLNHRQMKALKAGCHTAIALVVIVCFAAALHAEEAIADSAENFIKDWAATLNKNDPENLMAFYDRSKKTEIIVSTGMRYQGYKAFQKAYRDDLKQLRLYDSSAKEIETRILGDTALVTFEHLFKIRILADDSRWQVHIRTTSVLHRVENKWKIVLEHSSPIRGVERMTRIGTGQFHSSIHKIHSYGIYCHLYEYFWNSLPLETYSLAPEMMF